ncbi:MAG: hypothetical protein J6J12_03900 [Oscillospiraceae bacterium]|nr:hypothetical protein [Oscillospiraceae bacterium]
MVNRSRRFSRRKKHRKDAVCLHVSLKNYEIQCPVLKPGSQGLKVISLDGQIRKMRFRPTAIGPKYTEAPQAPDAEAREK